MRSKVLLLGFVCFLTSLVHAQSQDPMLFKNFTNSQQKISVGGKGQAPPIPSAPVRALFPKAKEAFKQKADAKKDTINFNFYGPTFRNGCSFWLGSTCLDKDIEALKTDGMIPHFERLNNECGSGKGEYCYLIYRYYFDSGQDDRARKFLSNICKDYPPLCLREIGRLTESQLFVEARSLINNLCKTDSGFDCSGRLENVRKLQDRNIFLWAQGIKEIRKEKADILDVLNKSAQNKKQIKINSLPLAIKLQKLDKLSLKVKTCHWDSVLAGKNILVCDTDSSRFKIKPMGDDQLVRSMVRELPKDITWEKQILGVVAELSVNSTGTLISLVVTEK